MAKGRRRSRETPRGDRARSGRARAEVVPGEPPPGVVGAEPVEAERGGSRAALAESRLERPVERSQAEVRPVEDDGVRTVAVITVLWAVAFVALALQIGSLEAQGRGWWLWTCLAGVGLGLLGLEYTRKRRDAIESALEDARAAEADQADDADAAGAGDLRADDDVEGRGGTGPMEWTEPAVSEPAVVSEPAASEPVEPEPVEPGLGRPHSGPATERLSADTTTTRPIDTGHGEARPVHDTSAPAWPAAQPSPRTSPRPRPRAEPVPEREIGEPGVVEPAVAERPPSPWADDPVAKPRHNPPSRPGPTRRRAGDVQVPKQPEPSQELPPETSPSPEPRPDTAAPPAVGTPHDTAVPRAGAAGAPLSELFGEPPAGSSRSADDDEPLLDTTLGGGHAARRHDTADADIAASGESIDTGDTGEITEGGGRQYRGRRARRSDTA